MSTVTTKTGNALASPGWQISNTRNSRGIVDAFFETVSNLKNWQVASLFVAYFFLVAFVDYFSGDELALSLLYVPVIGFITIRLSLAIALKMSLICAVIWLIDDIIVEANGPTHGEIVATIVHFACFSVIATLICRLNSALKRERFLSRHDFLTGLPNMHSFKDQASNAISKDECHFSVVFIDCDNFKSGKRHAWSSGRRRSAENRFQTSARITTRQ